MPDVELRPLLHLLLHLVVPVATARVFWPKAWKRAALWMLAAWVIDLDHLLADPVYAPGRCSIGFHPLHTWPAMLAYGALVIPRKTRWFGVGLVIHIVLDGIDCLMM
ncbi:hypothetical protein IB223_07665 [Pseudoxanthomonas sp. PXM03]|uniref:DUF6122 family protein n=1 Tax=Pseudoxanthomonas sp. PXM03 TaxID=2769284 RepID=UPI00178081D6|nr:DUF6122 family protein [Pseudoxanthomonas sp. PXM03]MBD9435964.1 hypothetical protein [Pseudoxanthomonas sp. PXM03]